MLHYLAEKTTYLAGNIHTTKQSDYGVKWREDLIPRLTQMNIKVINPCTEGVGDSAKDQIYFKELIAKRDFITLKKDFYKVIRKDLKAVDKSDFLIFYHNPTLPTIGSIHEVINASNQKKPVLIMCDEKDLDHLNPWLLTIIKPQWLFTTWDNMFTYLYKIDNGELDTSHWWF
jgi:hypothetical protein